jgi:hypothetical protein
MNSPEYYVLLQENARLKRSIFNLEYIIEEMKGKGSTPLQHIMDLIEQAIEHSMRLESPITYGVDELVDALRYAHTRAGDVYWHDPVAEEALEDMG